LAQGNAAPFRSQDPFTMAAQDWVIIDAIADEDENSLRSNLLFLGMTDAVAFHRIVSSHLPISSIPSLAALKGLRFAQPAAAITNTGRVTAGQV
jgi:hypothetical protein